MKRNKFSLISCHRCGQRRCVTMATHSGHTWRTMASDHHDNSGSMSDNRGRLLQGTETNHTGKVTVAQIYHPSFDLSRVASAYAEHCRYGRQGGNFPCLSLAMVKIGVSDGQTAVSRDSKHHFLHKQKLLGGVTLF